MWIFYLILDEKILLHIDQAVLRLYIQYILILMRKISIQQKSICITKKGGIFIGACRQVYRVYC